METRKVLGQSNPLATTLTDLYTVPAATQAICSTLTICNRSGTGTAFRVSVAIAGAVDDNKQYIAYDASIAGNTFVTVTIGITLGATDVVRVYATLATLSFQLFGVELT
jgi:hypothetical protein